MVISLFSRLILVIINSIFMILSLVMIIGSAVLLTGGDIFHSLTSSMTSKLRGALMNTKLPDDIADISLSHFLAPVGWGMLMTGLIIGGVALVGFVGAFCSIKPALYMYIAIISFFFMAQFLTIVLFLVGRTSFDEKMKPFMRHSLIGYAGVDSKDPKTMAWNALMNYEQCCGVDDYTDFSNRTKWPATISGKAYKLRTPVMCCVDKSTNFTCAIHPTDSTNYWRTGCYDKLMTLLVAHPLPIAIIIILIVLQTVIILFTMYILWK